MDIGSGYDIALNRPSFSANINIATETNFHLFDQKKAPFGINIQYRLNHQKLDITEIQPDVQPFSTGHGADIELIYRTKYLNFGGGSGFSISKNQNMAISNDLYTFTGPSFRKLFLEPFFYLLGNLQSIFTPNNDQQFHFQKSLGISCGINIGTKKHQIKLATNVYFKGQERYAILIGMGFGK